jgi:hypothetical protein
LPPKQSKNINHAVCGKGAGFAQQFIYKKGIQKFGEKGRKAALAEFERLHKRNCFDHIDVSQLTPSEEKSYAVSPIFD